MSGDNTVDYEWARYGARAEAADRELRLEDVRRRHADEGHQRIQRALSAEPCEACYLIALLPEPEPEPKAKPMAQCVCGHIFANHYDSGRLTPCWAWKCPCKAWELPEWKPEWHPILCPCSDCEAKV